MSDLLEKSNLFGKITTYWKSHNPLKNSQLIEKITTHRKIHNLH